MLARSLIPDSATLLSRQSFLEERYGPDPRTLWSAVGSAGMKALRGDRVDAGVSCTSTISTSAAERHPRSMRYTAIEVARALTWAQMHITRLNEGRVYVAAVRPMADEVAAVDSSYWHSPRGTATSISLETSALPRGGSAAGSLG